MKVTCVGIRPTQAQVASGIPALTPELLAACGARYSRNSEGLDSILSRVNPEDEDASVDSIFRMVDYGHQSIADMAPVAMFMDGISQWLALFMWSSCPTAGGQESSTRYVKIDQNSIVDPALTGISSDIVPEWKKSVQGCFQAYHSALEYWTKIGIAHPALLRIPESLAISTEPKEQRKHQRLLRNFAFDRARYYLPMASLTNVMMVMSARGWVALIQKLASHPLPEANEAARHLRDGLSLVAPRLIKHANCQESISQGLQDEFKALARHASELQGPPPTQFHKWTPFLDVSLPSGIQDKDFVSALQHHHHRYAWIGSSVRRASVRFGWGALPIADLRDLNRHRTGSKYFNLAPVGAYFADDEIESLKSAQLSIEIADFEAFRKLGEAAISAASHRLASCMSDYVYWLPFGTQCYYEHTTTAEHFIYQTELRTGLGAHYCYAERMRECLAIWKKKFPGTANQILEGLAEPE